MSVDIKDICNVRTVKKPWGYEEHVETNERYAVKRLFMKKGHQCSLQYHKIKKETIIAGLYNRLEIWDSAKWEAYKKQTEKESTKIAEELTL